MTQSRTLSSVARLVGLASLAIVIASCAVAASPVASSQPLAPEASASLRQSTAAAATADWHALDWLPADGMPTGAPDFAVTSWPGGLVAADGGQIWTSMDGTAWTKAAPDPALTGSVLVGLIQVPDGLLAIALPHPESCGDTPCTPDFDLWRSADAVHWTREPDPPFAHERLAYSFADGQIALLTSGDNDTTIWSSADGHNWTSVKIPAVEINSVARVSSGFVATGYVPLTADIRGDFFLAATKPSMQVAAWSSTDGRSWARIDDYDGPDTVLPGAAGYWGIQTSGLCGNQGNWWHSADGLRWQPDPKFGPYGSLDAERHYACGSAMVSAGAGRIATVRSADSGVQTIWLSNGDGEWRSLPASGGDQPEGIRSIRLTPAGVIAATNGGLRFGKGV